MKTLDIGRIRDSLVDVSVYRTEWVDGKLIANDDELVKRIVGLVQNENGFAACYGVSKVLAAHGRSVHDAQDADAARLYLENTFRAAAKSFELSKYSPVDARYDRVAAMDVDGFSRNKNFTPNSDHTESREYVTTKCPHFDAATPFIANLYGPTVNISDGFPIICNTRQYCRDKDLRPETLIENIPNNYNVAVKEEHCRELLEDYSFALRFDSENDVVMIVLFNEVIGGLAHAATQPRLTDEAKPSRRPIRHVEYQVGGTEDLKRWYDHYHLTLPDAGDHSERKTPPRYHRGESQVAMKFIDVHGAQ